MRSRTLETLAALACLAVSACMPEPPKPQKATDLDSIEPKESDSKSSADKKLPPIPAGQVATVNGEPISSADFRAIYDLKLKKYRRKGDEIPQSSDRRYRKSITERLIYQKVVELEAKSLGVDYDPKELAERQANQKKGIKDWDKHLDRRGESDVSLEAMLITELRESAIMANGGHLLVEDADVAAEYERVKSSYSSDAPRIAASHVLCKVVPENRPAGPDGAQEPTDKEKAAWRKAALEKCTGVIKLARAPGADFTAIALEHSEGPSSEHGGDLGIFSADRMVEAFSTAAFAMAPGEISKVPIETEFGFHVIKVHAVYAPGPLPLEALADKLRERLVSRKLVRGRHDLEKELLSRYEIDNAMLRLLGDDKATTRGLKKKKKPNPGAKKPDGEPPQ